MNQALSLTDTLPRYQSSQNSVEYAQLVAAIEAWQETSGYDDSLTTDIVQNHLLPALCIFLTFPEDSPFAAATLAANRGGRFERAFEISCSLRHGAELTLYRIPVYDGRQGDFLTGQLADVLEAYPPSVRPDESEAWFMKKDGTPHHFNNIQRNLHGGKALDHTASHFMAEAGARLQIHLKKLDREGEYEAISQSLFEAIGPQVERYFTAHAPAFTQTLNQPTLAYIQALHQGGSHVPLERLYRWMADIPDPRHAIEGLDTYPFLRQEVPQYAVFGAAYPDNLPPPLTFYEQTSEALKSGTSVIKALAADLGIPRSIVKKFRGLDTSPEQFNQTKHGPSLLSCLVPMLRGNAAPDEAASLSTALLSHFPTFHLEHAYPRSQMLYGTNNPEFHNFGLVVYACGNLANLFDQSQEAAIANALLNGTSPEGEHPWSEMAASLQRHNKKLFSYPKRNRNGQRENELMDTLKGMANAILMPAVCQYIANAIPNDGDSPQEHLRHAGLTWRAFNQIQNKLLPELMIALSQELGPVGILDISRLYHTQEVQEHIIRTSKDPDYRVDTTWPPLTETMTHPATELQLVPLTSSEMLREESDRLGHCVGWDTSTYDQMCQSSYIGCHIYSIRNADGQSISTVQLMENSADVITVSQHRAWENNDPPPEAEKALSWFLAELRHDPELTFSNMQALKEQRRQAENERDEAAIDHAIGYDWTDANARQRALEAYKFAIPHRHKVGALTVDRFLQHSGLDVAIEAACHDYIPLLSATTSQSRQSMPHIVEQDGHIRA